MDNFSILKFTRKERFSINMVQFFSVRFEVGCAAFLSRLQIYKQNGNERQKRIRKSSKRIRRSRLMDKS